MGKHAIIYWICTGGLILLMGAGSIPNILSSEQSLELMRHLGYPDYLLPFLGWAKLLGLAAILIPGINPRVKEWAYAGLAIDLTGALYSTLMVDGLTGGIVVFIVGYLFVAGSYAYYHIRSRSAAASKANGLIDHSA
ncbi:DoxX family protein [Paenibacillus sp. GCM10023252]|uniref:DoxX family protein n=1 Tax=Paenibacillus sp. GCM10023252 TaxID=3252649 RepID=UPI003613910E